MFTSWPLQRNGQVALSGGKSSGPWMLRVHYVACGTRRPLTDSRRPKLRLRDAAAERACAFRRAKQTFNGDGLVVSYLRDVRSKGDKHEVDGNCITICGTIN
jgi:hypothetical protein